MKKLYQRTFLLFLVFNILFSHVGFGFFVHECKISHRKRISIQNPSECCPTPNLETKAKTSLKKTKCCSITKTCKQAFQHGELTQKLAKNSTNQVFILPNHSFPEFKNSYVAIAFSSNGSANSPPFQLKNFQTLYQNFLI